MKRVILSTLLLFGSTNLACASAPNERLNAALKEYRSIKNSSDACRLSALDKELTNLARVIRKEFPLHSAKFVSPEYTEIGISVGHYSDELEYSGELLGKAHRANPNSACRKYTLFAAEVIGGPEETKHLRGAIRYLEEFPDGPYAANAHIIIGATYDDLLKDLFGIKAGRDYRRVCYPSLVTEQSLDIQIEEARRVALNNFEKGLALTNMLEDKPWLSREIAVLKSGAVPDTWFGCDE